jgi:hypothetical protein
MSLSIIETVSRNEFILVFVPRLCCVLPRFPQHWVTFVVL